MSLVEGESDVFTLISAERDAQVFFFLIKPDNIIIKVVELLKERNCFGNCVVLANWFQSVLKIVCRSTYV